DIDPETYNVDPGATRKKLAATDADAILAVHLYGLPADVLTLRTIADEADVPLVEDAAQAHGAAVDGESVGTFGDAAAFSFYPTKNMTTGEGGMVLTPHQEVADRAASYINHGRPSGDSPYAHTRVGHNLRMTSLAAAIGRVQLEKLPDWIDARRDNAEKLSAVLTDVPGIETPTEPPDRRHAYHQYTVSVVDRDRFADHLAEAGVGSAVYYPTPIPDLAAYDGYHPSTPVADEAAESVLSLPVHPGLSENDLDRVVATVSDAAARRA
ncbi:MAG: DegT/DnrJ/EryC1/StrS family aminotransferase, partial [Halorhabdus sp.]